MTDKEFLDAIKTGNVVLVTQGIEDNTDLVNTLCEDTQQSAFEMALTSGFSSVVTILLNAPGFDMNHIGHNPLRLAVDLGFTDVATELLEKGANPNYRPEGMSSALLLCLENEYFDLAELMVSKGAELNIRNDNGWTPLIWASIKGRKKSVEFLLKHKANINVCNNDGWNAITGAYFKKRTDIVKILKENGAIFSAKYAEAALLSAYQNGYLDIVNQLLDDGISPNVSDDGNSLLILSAKNGDLVLVDKLIKVGADVNYNSTQGLLSILSTNGYDEQIELAIKAGAYINRKDDTNRSALYLAVMGNRVSTVKLLIDAGADVNVTSKSGYTPLLITAHYGYLELAKLLKENNANLEAKVDGRNAIGHALYRYKKTTEPVDRMCKQVSELLLNEG